MVKEKLNEMSVKESWEVIFTQKQVMNKIDGITKVKKNYASVANI